MNEFVESLRRLFNSGKVSSDTVRSLFTKGKITSSEFVYITAKENKS
jgi:hypothetical protein